MLCSVVNRPQIRFQIIAISKSTPPPIGPQTLKEAPPIYFLLEDVQLDTSLSSGVFVRARAAWYRALGEGGKAGENKGERI